VSAVYRGVRWAGDTAVRVWSEPVTGPLQFIERGAGDLPKRLDLYNHSPTGFEWGYHGSGPAQLALAILAHHIKDDERAVRLHQYFKDDVVAHFDRDEWEITSEDIDRWLELLPYWVEHH
jgi:hypothetical protein